jgi:hypothetical protein
MINIIARGVVAFLTGVLIGYISNNISYRFNLNKSYKLLVNIISIVILLVILYIEMAFILPQFGF